MAKRTHRSRKLPVFGRAQKTTHPDPLLTTDPHRASLHQISYRTDSIHASQLTAQHLPDWQAPTGSQTWINMHGVHDQPLLNAVGKRFHLHPLVLEDISNTEQRPKLDIYPEYLFLETKLFYYDSEQYSVSAEQISIVLSHDWLLTFQERPTGSFEPVRERLRQGQVLLRQSGVDYLCYALLDSLLERYFALLESMNEDAEQLEASILNHPTPADLQNIHRLKHVTIQLRRAVYPLREVINSLIRNEHGFFNAQTLPYLRDVYDHTVHFTESLEAIRDTLSGLMDIYMTSLSQRVNMEVRALTVVTMLFMPPTLIAGIFGMNFTVMPWLAAADGFWWAMLLMGGIAGAMLLVFWRRQWLTSRRQDN